jgi:hypothetical protein
MQHQFSMVELIEHLEARHQQRVALWHSIFSSGDMQWACLYDKRRVSQHIHAVKRYDDGHNKAREA